MKNCAGEVGVGVEVKVEAEVKVKVKIEVKVKNRAAPISTLACASIPEFLADHQAIKAAIEYADANTAKGGIHNIGSVPRRVH
jgi:hypothetical protein